MRSLTLQSWMTIGFNGLEVETVQVVDGNQATADVAIAFKAQTWALPHALPRHGQSHPHVFAGEFSL